MSGVNRLINSKNTIEGNSQQSLKEKLMQGNTSAVEATNAGIPCKTPIKGAEYKENKYKL